MPGDAVKTSPITIRVSVRDKAYLDTIADDEGFPTRSAFIRAVISARLVRTQLPDLEAANAIGRPPRRRPLDVVRETFA